jgi:hypothetical protein
VQKVLQVRERRFDYSNKKHSYRSKTALARKQCKGKTVGSQTVGGSDKFFSNVPKLLLEVSLSQFPFPTIISQIFGVNEIAVPCDMQNIPSINKIEICSF